MGSSTLEDRREVLLARAMRRSKRQGVVRYLLLDGGRPVALLRRDSTAVTLDWRPAIQGFLSEQGQTDDEQGH